MLPSSATSGWLTLDILLKQCAYLYHQWVLTPRVTGKMESMYIKSLEQCLAHSNYSDFCSFKKVKRVKKKKKCRTCKC